MALVELKIKQLYYSLIREVSNSASTEKYTEPFDLKNYPKTNKIVEKGIKNLFKSTVGILEQATTKEWIEAVKYNNTLYKPYINRKLLTPERVLAYTDRNLNALKSFQTRKIAGMNLSDRVWRNSLQYRGELELGLDIGIKDGKSASELSRDLRQYLVNPDKLFRRVRDERGELVLSKNAKKYNPGQGVYRSSYKNAMRLTRTEINMAYRASDYEQNQKLDFVLGIEVRRSNKHYDCDICESLKGKYPKDFKFVGWHPQCYSDDSFVLTNRGWQLFKDVDKSDLIFSLNPNTRLPEWVGVSQMQQYHHKGKMVHFSSRNLDCLVTEEHEMVYLNKSDGKIKRKHAIEFGKGNGAFYRGCNWIGSFDRKIQIGTHVFDLGDFSEFMGYWLSDGSLIRNYQIKIAHQDGRISKENIKDCCERMGFDVGGTSGSVDIYSKDLNSYLRKYGVSYEKYVPLEIKNSNSSIIQRFLDAYIQCDGHERKARPFIGNRGSICYPKNSERTYFTTSNQMASDIGEMILKIGKRPSYSIDKIKGKEHKFKNGIYTINHDLYRISECNSLTATTFDKDLVDYHGEVYDLTLERNHIMYIRRNGKCFWGSNCRCHTVSILSEEDDFIDWLNKLDTDEETVLDSNKEIKDVPDNFKDWINDNQERIVKYKSLPYFMNDNSQYVDKGILKERMINQLMDKAKSSGDEVFNSAQELAKKYGGYTTPINYKSKESIERKLDTELNGDISKIKDSVRITVILDKKYIEKSFENIKNNINFTEVKLQTPEKYMGYSGVLSNTRTKNGLIGEIQVNTEKMIYAKEKPENAKKIIGLKRWNEIRKETGQPGGLGHLYYEEYRITSKNTEKGIKRRKELEKLSNEYYKHFR